MNSGTGSILLCLLLLTACSESRESARAREIDLLRAQLMESRQQLRSMREQRDLLNERINLATRYALQMRNETLNLQTSTSELADAVNRLSYEDWNKVVPDVQLTFSDVENASRDLDSRVVRVLNSLSGSNRR